MYFSKFLCIEQNLCQITQSFSREARKLLFQLFKQKKNKENNKININIIKNDLLQKIKLTLFLKRIFKIASFFYNNLNIYN